MVNTIPLIADAFAARLSADFEETPFVVTPAGDGFLVGWDLQDARWITLLKANRVRANVSYRVRVRGLRARITPSATRLNWHAAPGTPVKLKAVHDIRLVLGQLPDGTDAVFSTAAALDHIRAVGESLGLQQPGERPAATRESRATQRAAAQSVPSPR